MTIEETCFRALYRTSRTDDAFASVKSWAPVRPPPKLP
jgi:hypothetical protein